MSFFKTFLLIGLVVIFAISAFAVIVKKHQSRSLFMDIQKLEKILDNYEIEWGKLQLEQTTLTNESRIDRMAREQLKLVSPQRGKTIYIKP